MSAAALATRQTAALAWRSIITTMRLPQAWFPALFFPLVLMAIFTASFGGAPGNIPGFPPIRGFLDFAVCGAIVQGVLIAGTTAGAAFATDIEHGFFDRLVASPTSRVSILTGRLGASVALGVFQALLFLGIAAIFGARVDGGFAQRNPVAGRGRPREQTPATIFARRQIARLRNRKCVGAMSFPHVEKPDRGARPSLAGDVAG